MLILKNNRILQIVSFLTGSFGTTVATLFFYTFEIMHSEPPVKILNAYKGWKPLLHSVFKSTAQASAIHKNGYMVIPFLNQEEISILTDFYNQEHNIEAEKGGMFYSLYSKDLDYRQRVHSKIAELVKPKLDLLFKDYKNIVNTFITKKPGPASEFYVHQDTTALDEFEHSPLSIWIPLQDMTSDNGAMAVVEKSHWFFSPYRSISFKQPFAAINNTLRQYLKPIYMKAGEALVFDPRVVHNSMPNLSDKDRLVVLCGVFPQNAEFITCFKESEPGSKIELILHDDVFILRNENFYYNCHERPKTGVTIGTVDDEFADMSAETFEELCRINNIRKQNEPVRASDYACEMIPEPDNTNLTRLSETPARKRGGIWHKVKAIFG